MVITDQSMLIARVGNSMATFDPSIIQSTTYEDAIPEIIFRFSELEKAKQAADPNFSPRVALVFDSSAKLTTFSGSLPSDVYLGDDGKVKFDSIEYIEDPGT